MTYEHLFAQSLEQMNAGHFQEARAGWSAASDLLMEDGSDEALAELPLVTLNQALCCLELSLHAEAADLCQDALEECSVALGGELGQQLLGALVEGAHRIGDLDRARAASETAWQALEEELQDDCQVSTVVVFAQKRAALARDMSRPDDAEEALATGFEHLDALLANPDLEPEARREALLSKAGLHETRAQNRHQGRALEIAQMDLEDAVTYYTEALGPDHPETQRTAQILLQLHTTT